MSECKCYINHLGLHGNGNVEEIIQCPLCKAAPKLREACRATISLLAEIAEMNIQPFPFSAVELNKQAKAAIAAAE